VRTKLGAGASFVHAALYSLGVSRRLLLAVAAAAVVAGLVGVATAGADGPIPWCGSGEPTTDQPDAVSAVSWHVLYAVPSNGTDRFAQFAPHLAADVQAMSNWWLGQDSTRKPRFDLLDAPGCGSEYGRVDITFVKLAEAAGSDDFDTIVSDLKAAGFDNPDKGYLVYVDDTPHAGTQTGVCGEGGTDETAYAYSLVFLQACGQETDDATRQLVATHELVHGLDAVLPQAPHYCNDGHVCDSQHDLMKAVFYPGDSLANTVLDAGRDDYYGHSGTWPDTRNSLLLYRYDETLPAPPVIAGLTATSSDDIVVLDWSKTVPVAGNLYRIYADDGSLLAQQAGTQYTMTAGGRGQTLQFTVRSENGAGYLSAPATLRFKVGFGIVDANGALLKDTVAPAEVGGLRATRSGKLVVLHWRKVADPIRLRGYRVAVRGGPAHVVRGTTASFPLAKVRGRTITVQAVDEAGNLSTTRTVRIHG
jgi:hypothetical protein